MIRSLSSTALILCAALYLAGCKPTKVIEDLGTLGGPSSMGFGINNVGNVCGSSLISSGDPHAGGIHAFLYVDGLGMIDVGVLPSGSISQAYGINNGNLIVGGSWVEGFVPHAFLANATLNLTDLGTLGGESSVALDINDQGQVTGEASNKAGDFHAFIWTSAGMRDIGTLGGDMSVGRSINETGQVAGESKIGTGATVRAFRFTEGIGMVDLGALTGGANSSAYGINNSGQVVGESDTGPVINPGFRLKGFTLFGTHAFLWTDGVGMKDLGHLGGRTSLAMAISNNGTVVGTSTLINGNSHAFRWTQAGGMIDLNTLIPSNSGWVLVEAFDVNDRGQITGVGLHNGSQHAFRYNPPEVVNSPSLAPTIAR